MSLGQVPGPADAGISDYPSPLYLSGTPASSSLPTAYALVASSGPGQPTGQISGNITCLLCSSGSLGSSSYSYAYTVVDPSGGETAINAPAPAFMTVTGANGKSVEVTGLPTGVHVKLYRSTTNPALYNLVADLPNNNSSTYDVDSLADSNVGALLPQAQNRVKTSTTGFQDFSAGTPVTSASNSASTAYDSTPTTPPADGKGWIVDGPGGVSFPGGNWSFTAVVRQNGTVSLLGTAHLAVGAWKVTTSGGAITSSTLLVDPTCSAAPCAAGPNPPGPGENTTNFVTALATKAGTTHTNTTLDGLPNTSSIAIGQTVVGADIPAGTTVTAIPTSTSVTLSKAATGSYSGNYQFNGVTIVTQTANVPWFTLASNEHLYVQFYRRQTTSASTTTGSLATMYAYDGMASITHPSVPNAPTIVSPSPADAARINTMPQLTATMSDPYVTDTGTLSFEVCSDSACNTVVQSGSATGIADAANGSWSPTALADGKYYWNVQATDSVNNKSVWSSTRSFTVDTVAPGSPTLSSPIGGSRVNSAGLHATFVDSDSTDSGTVTFKFCGTDATCSGAGAQSTSAAVSGGAAVTWTASPGGDGTYYWQAKAQDVAGNTSAWSAIQSFVLDTNPPATPVLTGPTDGAYLDAVPTLEATFSGADAGGDSGTILFQVCPDTSCTVGVTSGLSASLLANGAAGSWAPTGLADGLHYWQARSQDAAGNLSGWSAMQSFTLDTTAPTVPTLPAIAISAATAPTLTATYSDPPATDSGTLTFQLCSTVTCATVLQSSVSAVANGGSASWTPPLTGDGIYYVRVKATDAAGNVSSSAASVFSRDSTPPPAPVLDTLSGERVNAPPQLVATVIEPSNPGDSSRLLVELCTDPRCTSIVTTGYSGFVSVDTAAGWQAPSLSDGVYYWRALAEDAVGNQSPWSAVASFVVDTVAPPVPDLGGPAVGAIVNAPHLTGVPGTSATGVEFQVCADAACANVLASGYAFSPGTGAAPSWTPTGLSDGTYFWRISAHDAAGNESAWSETKSFVLDQTPPGTPRGLQAKVTGMTLTLRWQTPTVAHHLSGYTLLVNGKRTRTLTLKTHMVRIRLRKSDTRFFSVASLDAAGNVSRPTREVGPPALSRHVAVPQAHRH